MKKTNLAQFLNRKPIFLLFVVLAIIISFSKVRGTGNSLQYPSSSLTWWDFQAVDTMKYSRDLAAEKLNDQSFDKVIDKQVKDIADTGATHVAIATPYDEEFLPFLKKWVSAARKYKLKVWFRGNFAGWEEWFGFTKITREQHLAHTRQFILANQGLFENGDYFTACPECENGGPGNPFTSGDMEGHKKFLIDSYNVANAAFKEAGRNVQVNLNSMNGDIAREIMDEQTTARLGGVVTIDHYVEDPKTLNDDINDFYKQSSAPVILGEYGAPIPDLHGNMTEKQQAEWIDESLSLLVRNQHLVGLSYWTNLGGSTQLWKDNGEPKLAVATLKKYFSPQIKKVQIRDELGRAVPGARVFSIYKKASTDENGVAIIPVLGQEELMFFKDGYSVQGWVEEDNAIKVTFRPSGLSVLYHLKLIFLYFWK